MGSANETPEPMYGGYAVVGFRTVLVGLELGYRHPVPRIRRPLLALIILVALLAIGYLIAAIR